MLRARCQRQRGRRAADERDERASPHGGPFPTGLAAARNHTVALERRCAPQQKLRADVADRSRPVIRRCRLNVRFARSGYGWAIYEYTPFCKGPGDVKSPRVMSRRRASSPKSRRAADVANTVDRRASLILFAVPTARPTAEC